MIAKLRRAWTLFRELTGDDAYERYLSHWRNHRRGQGGQPMDRAAFYRDEQRRKWDGVRRCC